MNAETLERLMLDRALGALPPDCEALLAAWLDARPEAAAACREFERTIDLARHALADGPAGSLPAFPAERLRRARQSDRFWRMTRNVMGIAASVLIGFGVHAMLFRAPTPQPAQAPPVVLVQGGPQRGPEATGDDTGFWSGRRLSERASGPAPSSSGRVIWRSPVRIPQRGDAT